MRDAQQKLIECSRDDRRSKGNLTRSRYCLILSANDARSRLIDVLLSRASPEEAGHRVVNDTLLYQCQPSSFIAVVELCQISGMLGRVNLLSVLNVRQIKSSCALACDNCSFFD